MDLIIENMTKSGDIQRLEWPTESKLSLVPFKNSSGENANFIFEVLGDVNDAVMHHFNTLFKAGSIKNKDEMAISDRMEYLKEVRCDLSFVEASCEVAHVNLVKCGGVEMPAIVGGMLKKFYYENLTRSTTMKDCVDYLVSQNVAGYDFDGIEETYRIKVVNLLFCLFAGMRLDAPWNCRHEYIGGSTLIKIDDEKAAFQSLNVEEFKDFLFDKTRMEVPISSGSDAMVIYKENGKYYVGLGFQICFP